MRVTEYPFKIVRLSCAKCDRNGQYSLQRFKELAEPALTLPDARLVVAAAAGCARAAADLEHGLGTDRCQAVYSDLNAHWEIHRSDPG